MRNEPLKNEVAIKNARGEIEIIDIHTGQIIANASITAADQHKYAFNYATAIAILQHIKEGKTLLQIAEMQEMPPMYVISQWQRTDRMFAEEMKLARLARAEYHHEKVLGLADKAAKGDYSKDEVPSIKLGADLYKWSAERANPEKYGAKVTHEGSTEKPILMRVINTGISRVAKEVVVVEAEIKEPEHGDSSEETREPSRVGSIGTGIVRVSKEAGSGSEAKDEIRESDDHQF